MTGKGSAFGRVEASRGKRAPIPLLMRELAGVALASSPNPRLAHTKEGPGA